MVCLSIRCVKQTCQHAVSTQSTECREALAVALGCMHRLKGGMALSSVLPMTVETLFSLLSRPVGGVHLWGLHGLWLTASAASLNYIPFVDRTLDMLQDLMVRFLLSITRRWRECWVLQESMPLAYILYFAAELYSTDVFFIIHWSVLTAQLTLISLCVLGGICLGEPFGCGPLAPLCCSSFKCNGSSAGSRVDP